VSSLVTDLQQLELKAYLHFADIFRKHLKTYLFWLRHFIAFIGACLKPVAHGEIKLKYNKIADRRGFVSADRRRFCFISVSGMCGR